MEGRRVYKYNSFHKRIEVGVIEKETPKKFKVKCIKPPEFPQYYKSFKSYEYKEDVDFSEYDAASRVYDELSSQRAGLEERIKIINNKISELHAVKKLG
jgi:hypothetical protein